MLSKRLELSALSTVRCPCFFITSNEEWLTARARKHLANAHFLQKSFCKSHCGQWHRVPYTVCKRTKVMPVRYVFRISGKSSLVEALTKITLPRQDGTCTRSVTEVLTKNAPAFSCSVVLKWHRQGGSVHTEAFEELPDLPSVRDCVCRFCDDDTIFSTGNIGSIYLVPSEERLALVYQVHLFFEKLAHT